MRAHGRYRSWKRVVLLRAGLGIALALPHATQTTVQSWNPLGWIYVDSLPDLDGDGFREIVVGDTIWRPHGRVYAYSGLQRTKLWEVSGATQTIGRYVRTVGDVNGDGFPDIATADGVSAFFLSGRDGSQLFVSPSSWTCIEPLGDMNGDDLADVLLSGVHVLLGGSFTYLHGPTAGSSHCAPVGDMDGDGVPDYAVGFPKAGFDAAGLVLVYSGASGEVIHHVEGNNRSSEFGAGVAGPGDITGDGVPDFVVGEPAFLDSMALSNTTGCVFFYDGRTGELFDELRGVYWVNFFFGEQLVPAGDVNGNGTPDILVGSYPNAIYVIEGATRETIYVLNGNVRSPIRGEIDWTGDDFPDFLVRPALEELVSGAPIGVSVEGRGCAPGGVELPRIGATGSAEIGANFPVHVSRIEPDDRAILLLGAPGASSFGEPIRTLLRDCGVGIAAPIWMPAHVDRVRPGEGAGTIELVIPNDPALIGTAFHAQWVVLEGPRRRQVKAVTRLLRVEIQAPTSATRVPSPQSRAMSKTPSVLGR